jgi:ADP-ribosyl-[dinitrogen reductase] hydrolase
MVGGGPFSLEPGQWTDDTSMALCLAESLLERDGFDAMDQMDRYVDWWQNGHLSSTGECFDIGVTTRESLERYTGNRDPFAGSTRPDRAGNGSLMRLAPVAMFFHGDADALVRHAGESSRTTHGALEAVECCQLFALMLSETLAGRKRDDVLFAARAGFTAPNVQSIARGHYREKTAALIVGSGYSIASLEAALWCFHNSASFEAAVLMAANLGDDTDTTAAITGQIAGAFFGVDGIPRGWLQRLSMSGDIDATARRLFERSEARTAGRRVL